MIKKWRREKKPQMNGRVKKEIPFNKKNKSVLLMQFVIK